MNNKEKIKKMVGYKNINRLKKVLATKKLIKAFQEKSVKKFNYSKNYFDDCIEIKQKGKNIFGGYYDLKQLNNSGDQALIHIVDKKALAGKDCTGLGIYKMETGDIEVFSQSKAWSWQQGARLRWHPTEEKFVLYNDFEGSKYVTRIFDLDKKEIVETIPVALYDITSDGNYGLSLDFARLQRLRPGYGYSCYEDTTSGIEVPNNSGVFLWEKASGEVKEIIALEELAKTVNDRGVEHYLNHISISPSGTKFLFFHLWSFGLGMQWKMKLYTCNIDGTDLTCIDDSETISHYCWDGEDRILATALANEQVKHAKYIIYDLAKGKKSTIDSPNLLKDGHPTFTLDPRVFVSDTYPQSNSQQYVFCSDITGKKYKKLISVYANPFLIDEYRCDLHPRVDLAKSWISIDSTYTGCRSVIFLHKRAKEDKKKPLKIGFIAHGLGDGGAERVESILANYLVEQGYQVLFVAALSPNRVYEIDERVSYTYRLANSDNMLIKLAQKNINVYKQLKAFNPDMIVSFLTNEAFLSELKLKRPSVYTLRNDPYNYNCSGMKGKIRQYLFGQAKKIVFQTSGAREYFDDNIQQKGVIIENPIKEGLPYWQDYQHEKAIVTACRLEQQKNIPLMLKAFAKFSEGHHDYKLKICGDGQLKEELQQLVKELSLKDKVEFLGFREDIYDIMASSMMFVLSSDYEGVSNSMLEALSMGMPVVCTDSSPGGAATYIESGINGILTTVGNVDEFYLALCKVADDEAFKKKISKNAAKIRDELKSAVVLNKWEAVLKEATK